MLASLLNLTGHAWVDDLLMTAAAVGAMGVLWRAIVRPLWRFQRKINTTFDTTIPRLADIAEAAPTILTIAAELRSNGGASIKDSIDRIEKSVAVSATTLAALSEYTHTENHKIKGTLQEIGLRYTILDGRVSDIHETVKEQGDLTDLLTRWAPAPPTAHPSQNP